MWFLVSAVVTASLLGSMHCVGMCGPLAIWASGASERFKGRSLLAATTLYHLGRMVTYATAGLIAGAAGQLVDVGGHALGIQLVAARLVGSTMIVLGFVSLWRMWRSRRATAPVQANLNVKPSWITQQLVKLRPYIFRLPLPLRGLTTGLLTALLPCGWLYLFALVAAGTGSLSGGALVMTAFWLGTVPALIGLVTSTQLLATRFRKTIPAFAALLLIVGGCYTAAGRGFADFNSLSDLHVNNPLVSVPASQGAAGEAEKVAVTQAEVNRQMQELVQTPLPCCLEKSHDQPTAVKPSDSQDSTARSTALERTTP